MSYSLRSPSQEWPFKLAETSGQDLLHRQGWRRIKARAFLPSSNAHTRHCPNFCVQGTITVALLFRWRLDSFSRGSVNNITKKTSLSLYTLRTTLALFSASIRFHESSEKGDIFEEKTNMLSDEQSKLFWEMWLPLVLFYFFTLELSVWI